MRRHVEAVVMIGALFAVLAAGPTAAPGADQPVKATPALGTHSVRGVVKSVDASRLVIARSGRHRADLTFALCDTTLREGQIAIGQLVSIRYVMDGDARIATAVSAHPENSGRSADRPVSKSKGGT